MSQKNPGQSAPVGDRVDVAIAIITRAGKVLICQRPDHGSFAGYWEFPGGKREPNETVADCLRREVVEELAIQITPLRALRTVDHDYPRGRIRLHPFICDYSSGELQLLACQDAAWVDPKDLTGYQFPPANNELIQEAIACLTTRAED
jgi:mutator protein MutT